MATDPKLQPLQKTLHALKEISSSLKPFLKLLRDENTDEKNKNKNESPSTLTPHKRAEAEAAVALSIGTLRYMGARLKGLDRGRKKEDPLRKELDQIRALLVSLRKIESEVVEKKKTKNSKDRDPKIKKETAGKASSVSGKSKRRLSEEKDDVVASNKKKKKQKTSK